MTVALRQVSPESLYEPGYRWDGSCQCGANDWDCEEWACGFRVVCRQCGWWECTHSVAGVHHTSDGKWAASNPKCRPPQGCPTLSEAPETEPGRPLRGAREPQ